MLKLKPLGEQTIVITGASSGIGLATARKAANSGAHVILVARSAETLSRVCEEIVARGGRADFLVADVGQRHDIEQVVETVINEYGGFDTWVNNAGVGLYSRLQDVSYTDHERLFQTNYWGVVYGSLEALKHLQTRSGALINVGSLVSDVGMPLLGAYAATKHAVKGFTDSLRLELKREAAPVSVTLIKPSSVQTPFPVHAMNYLRGASELPPPVYHPDLVADAILAAAVKPRREIFVGGAGRLMSLSEQLFPRMSDAMYARLLPGLMEDRAEPKQAISALHEARGDGETTGETRGYVRKSSCYTSAQTHPGLAIGVGLLAGAVTMAALRSNRGRSRVRSPGANLGRVIPRRGRPRRLLHSLAGELSRTAEELLPGKVRSSLPHTRSHGPGAMKRRLEDKVQRTLH